MDVSTWPWLFLFKEMRSVPINMRKLRIFTTNVMDFSNNKAEIDDHR